MRRIEEIDVNYVEMWDELNKKNEEFEKAIGMLRAGYNLSNKHLISIDDLEVGDIKLIFRITWAFKDKFITREKKKIPLLKGKTIMNFFFETSTRTKTSFELAGKELNADVINMSGSSSSMSKKGESLKDTAQTLNSMKADLMIMRHSKAGTCELIKNDMDCPILNAGDGCHEHPTQALLDAYTICEKIGTIRQKTILIVGDVLHSRVAGSLIRIIKKMKGNVRVVAPPTMIPHGLEEEFDVDVYYDIDEAIKDVDVVYALRVQTERASAGFIPSIREYAKNFVINPERLKLAKKDAIVMHPGPVIREIDLRSEVLDGPQCVVLDQVTNGYCVRLALIYLLIRKAPKSEVKK
jgi:aspartate carbamoyltransferase catalytic subunit